jgi:hypothetical protein
MERMRVAGRFVRQEAEGAEGETKRVRVAAPRPKFCRTFTRKRLAEALPEIMNQFLSASRYAGRLASNSVVQYALWLNEATPEQHDRLIRWWQDEIEGTGRVPLLSCEQKPEVLRFAGGTDADLRLAWQEALIRMIANAFELPPMMLGLQSDVNRSTAGEMADEAFQSAVVPVAKLLAEHITRSICEAAWLAGVRVLLQRVGEQRRDAGGADPDRAAARGRVDGE